MFHVIIVILKGGAGIIRRVYVDTLYLSGIEGQQGLEGFKVVALDYDVSGVVGGGGGGGSGIFIPLPTDGIGYWRRV
jgi:hypothetical protein